MRLANQILFVSTLIVFSGCSRDTATKAPQPTSTAVKSSEGKSTTDAWPPAPTFGNEVGCRLWEYCVPYQSDIQQAVNDLRRQEFAAGRFYRSELHPATIDDAIRNADAPGTRSILDIDKVLPTHDIETISPAPPEELRKLFGTDKPTRELVEQTSKKYANEFFKFLETYGRCEGVYIILYSNDKPIEIYIAGWSSG